jgi:GT2 family glycosyltransferase
LLIVIVDCHPESLDSGIVDECDVYITLPSNPGFGAASNRGIRRILEEEEEINSILLLNPDAYVDQSFFYNLKPVILDDPCHSPISPLILFDRLLTTTKLQNFNDVSNFIREYRADPLNNFLIDEQGNFHFGESLLGHANSDLLVGTQPNSDLYKLIPEYKWREDQMINNMGSYYKWPDIAGDIGFNRIRSTCLELENIERIAWCGAGVVFSRSYLKQVGGFDERFFLYYEDTEKSLRGAKMGLLPIFTPSLVVFHRHSAATGRDLEARGRAIWQSRALFCSIVSGKRTALLTVIGRFAVGLSQNVRQYGLSGFRSYTWKEFYWSLRGVLTSFKRSKVELFQ